VNDYSNPLILTDQEMRPYLAAPGISSTALAYADESMAKYRAYCDGKIRIEGKHLDLGTAVHSYLESQNEFWNRYILRPAGMDRRTKAGKEAYAEFEQSAGAKVILEADDWRTIQGIAANYEGSDDLLLQMCRESPGEAECSHFWKEAGLDHKCRPDRLIRPGQWYCERLCERWPELFSLPFGLTICVDFKTTSKPASPKSWSWACRDYRYLLKASHYIAGTKCDAFMWVVLETNPPYHVTRYLMSPISMQNYGYRRQELLEYIKECEEKNDWPGLIISDSETLI
jgi:exodeoxyribonuclease VIII